MTRNDANSTAEDDMTKEHVFDKPANVRRVLVSLYALCGLLLLADFIVHRHIEHPVEGMPGFYAVYGFVGCVSLVIAARALRKMVMRGEDYYDG